MKKILKGLFKFLFIVAILVCTYFYDDIEKYINNINVLDNVKSTVKYDDDLKIYFVDVGQADCILIKYLNNNILIDAGNNEDGPLLVQYFKSLGVDKFDYVIGTHAHEDHIGGMDDIINNFQIDHFMMPDVITPTKTFEDVLDSLANHNVKFETPTIDSKFNVSLLNFQILFVGDDKSDLNNTSIVAKLSFGDTSYLFMGDATSSVENMILNKNISSDVLKVGHHGSQYSSSATFLKKVSPKYAVIQVGANNSYNHPKAVVLNKLKRICSKIYRTDLDGTVILTSDGVNINFETVKTNTNGG